MGCVRPTCKKAGRHAGMAVRGAKTLRSMFAVGRPRCKNSATDVCGWPSEMQKLCGRCLRLAVRDAKNSAADVCGQSFLHLGQPTANIGRRDFCISDSQPQTSAAAVLYLE